MKNIIIIFLVIGFIGCFATGKYLPVSNNSYKTDIDKIYFSSDDVSLIISGNYGRPDQYSQTSKFTVRFSDIKDTLTLIFSDAKLFSGNDSTKPFHLGAINGRGGTLNESTTLLPSSGNNEISFYYTIGDSSLIEPRDHIKMVTFILNLLHNRSNKKIYFPRFEFQS